jgi:ApaG protein
VDRVTYDPTLDAPPDRPFAFAYDISIHNDSQETISFFGRKWIIREDGSPGIQVVEGDGIVGQFPRLQPGQVFNYRSYHLILHTSRAHGAFYGTGNAGRAVYVEIPEFKMSPPLEA